MSSGQLPESLERAYRSAIQAYNAGIWDACATSCRKTLEGIAANLEPEAKGTLFEKLKQVFQSPTLTQPLVHVADVLRKGGNMGAHFDLEREMDEQTARVMLDLLDYFLEFAFALKRTAELLEKRLDSMDT